MTIKQIFLLALLLSTIGSIGLTIDQDQNIKHFDKRWLTILNKKNNNLNAGVFSSIVLNTYQGNDYINIIEIVNGKFIQQGTIKSFSTHYTDTPDQNINRVTIANFWSAVNENNALFDSKRQTIFYGSETDINNFYDSINYHNKIQLLDKKTAITKKRLQWNKKFVERACKEEYQCKNLKAEIEKTEKEINQLYQNL